MRARRGEGHNGGESRTTGHGIVMEVPHLGHLTPEGSQAWARLVKPQTDLDLVCAHSDTGTSQVEQRAQGP